MSSWKPNVSEITRVKVEFGRAKVSAFNRETTNIAKYRAPRKTGRLANGIGSSMRVNTATIRGRVGTRINYAAPVHEGALPHFIRPRRKKALAFYWEAAGRRVVFSQVYHPGIGATPFLTSAGRQVAAKNGFRWRRATLSRITGV